MQQGEQCCQPGIDIKDCPVGRHLDCHPNEVCQDDDGDGKWYCACVEGFSFSEEGKCLKVAGKI